MDIYIEQEARAIAHKTQVTFSDSAMQKIVLKEIGRALQKMADTPKGRPPQID